MHRFDTWRVPAEQIRATLDQAALCSLGETLDRRLAALATPNAYRRDEVTLAYLALLESEFVARPRSGLDHNAYIAPVLDHVLPKYPVTIAAGAFSSRCLDHVRSWVEASADYQQLVGGVINALQGRMTAVEIVSSGRVVFCPAVGMENEIRNRWFSRRIYAAKDAAGAEIPSVALQADIPKIDIFVQRNGLSTSDGVDQCRVPTEDWYDRHCSLTVDPVLSRQFVHVLEEESWAGFTKADLMKRIRPIAMLAAKRMFVHQRAQKIVESQRGEPVVFGSAVEVTDATTLARAVAQSAGCSEADGLAFVGTLVRPQGGEEKHDIMAFPLVSLSGNRIAFLPSVVLYGNWPLHLEQSAARSPGGSQIGSARDKRHLEAITGWLKGAGYKDVATDVLLKDLKGASLTDLDVVAVPKDGDQVLILQLKSFVTPTNLLTVGKAENDVQKAASQCDVASRNMPLVKTAVEKSLDTTLPKSWQLYQLIVVEAHTGVSDPHSEYPCVTVEWLRRELDTYGTSPKAVWEGARDLPDAKEFFESLLPSYALYEAGGCEICGPDERYAVFQYGSGSVAYRDGGFVVE